MFQDYSRLGHAHARGLHTPASVVGVAYIVKVARHLADALPLGGGPLLLLPARAVRFGPPLQTAAGSGPEEGFPCTFQVAC